MAYEVQKLVLFRTKPRDQRLTLEDLAAKIAEGSFDVRISGLFVYVREEDDRSSPAVRLSIAHGPDVLAESIAIAELHAVGRVDRTLVAACDARVEVAWKAEEADDVTDIVVALDPELEEYVAGVTWFANVKELSEGFLS